MIGYLQGCLPCKVKAVYVTQQPWYLSGVWALLKPFLGECGAALATSWWYPKARVGCLPCKVKAVYVTQQPWYLSGVWALLKPFLGECGAALATSWWYPKARVGCRSTQLGVLARPLTWWGGRVSFCDAHRFISPGL
jgi:hypothetical protein